MSNEIKKCPVCAGESPLSYENMPGYTDGMVFNIYACGTCQASFVDPLHTSSDVYEGIYKYADILPGYERYSRYAELVTKFNNPLNVLKNSEVSYWAVIQTIQNSSIDKKNIQILEIGSGLGYLTYSLNKAGYKTTGIDISVEAVNQAKKLYGDYFYTKNLFDMVAEGERWDMIVMMDVIEHVENPSAFIDAAMKLLTPGGKLLITTPNKSFAPEGSIWFSDVPPVHLYFFTEKALTIMAEKVSASCHFVDFTEFSKRFHTFQFDSSFSELLAGLPRLNADGTVRQAIAHKGLKEKFLGVKARYILSYIRRRLKKKNASARSVIMCAVLSKS